MDNIWDSDENFVKSLVAFSEIEGVRPDAEVATPPTIEEWNARVGANKNVSIFDMPQSHINEECTYVVSGRGRGGISSLIKPGEGARPSAYAVDDVRRKIREVAGPGFSNALIEQDVKAKTSNLTNYTNKETKLQLVPSPMLSPSNRSTPTYSSVDTPRNSPKRSSPTSTPRKSPFFKPNVPNSSRCSISPDIIDIELVEDMEKREEQIENAEVHIEQPTTPPPPLSVILKMGKKNQKVKEVPKVNSEQNGFANKEDAVEAKENVHLNGDRNDSWWRNGNSSDSGSSDEPNSWRRRDTSSPNRFFSNQWRNRKKSPSKAYNINSSEEFPALK